MEIFTLADKTARSFALTLRLLPKCVRQEVCLAYLLARATDTVADTNNHDAPTKLAILEELETVIGGKSHNPIEGLATLGANLPHAGEAELLCAVPRLLEILEQSESSVQQRIRSVLATIVSGQRLDIERFGTKQPGRLPDEEALLDYTWRVAGCVGEFWTDVLAANIPSSLTLPVATMRHLGRQYGQGLQLLNILRDAPSDWTIGRCYLPKRSNHALTYDQPRTASLDFPTSPESLYPAMRSWLPACRTWLDAGTEYGIALRGVRVRAASRLPATLGHLTLDALTKCTPEAWLARVKIPRSLVRRQALRSIWHALWA